MEHENLIEKGACAQVFKSTWGKMPAATRRRYLYEDTMPIAIKKPFDKDQRALSILANEIKIHRQLNHPNVVAFLCEQDSELILELIVGDDLRNRVEASSHPLPYFLQLSIALDIARGLNYLHDFNILHRDLKSENILLESRGESVIAKICDFGDAALSNGPFLKAVGTKEHLAPEIYTEVRRAQSGFSVDNYPYSKKSDIYSFSITLYFVACKKLPFEDPVLRKFFGLEQTTIAQKLLNGERDEVSPEVPTDFARLIIDCWEQQPTARPESVDVLERLTEMLGLWELSQSSQHTQGVSTDTRDKMILSMTTSHPHVLTTDNQPSVACHTSPSLVQFSLFTKKSSGMNCLDAAEVTAENTGLATVAANNRS